jgi:hypothetical protein
LADRISRLQDIVAEEFHTLIPLATLQAIAATRSGGVVNQSSLAASGGQALIDAITHQVATGRQSDTDIARLFLRRNGLDQEDSPVPAANTSAAALATEALGYLAEKSDTLGSYHADDPSGILEYCVETADGLTEILSKSTFEDVLTNDLQDTAMQAADAMVLMQLEDGAGPAADAVTLLIQMRRDLKAAIAA